MTPHSVPPPSSLSPAFAGARQPSRVSAWPGSPTSPVPSYGGSRLGHGSRGRVSRSGEPRWLPHRRSRGTNAGPAPRNSASARCRHGPGGARLAACAWNGGVLWLAFWRTVAGLAGGCLMALAGPAVQGAVAPAQRGVAGGSSSRAWAEASSSPRSPSQRFCLWGCPRLGSVSLSSSWVCGPLRMGAGRKPQWQSLIPPTTAEGHADPGLRPLRGRDGAAHGVFRRSCRARARARPPPWCAHLAAVRRGAMSGTLIGGRAADRWGGARALKLWLVFQVVALALALPPSTASLFASALLGGFAGLGVSAVALARARELAGSATGVVWVRRPPSTPWRKLPRICADAPVCAHGLACVRVRPRSCRVDCSVAALSPRPLGCGQLDGHTEA